MPDFASARNTTSFLHEGSTKKGGTKKERQSHKRPCPEGFRINYRSITNGRS
jgi:hypothetical protein